jgi:hypothetical protein
MPKRKSQAQARLIRNALGTVVGQTFLGAIGAAARGTRREPAKPRPFVPPKRGRKR